MRTGQILTLCALLSFIALNGCSQHSCLPGGGLPPNEAALLTHPGHPPDAADAPDGEASRAQPVTTVLNPEGAKREISLQECIALALEKGRVGGTSLRVLAYDPAIAYTAIEEGLSRFDARFTASMAWSAIDELQANVLSTVPLGLANTIGPSATGVGVAAGVAPATTAAIVNQMINPVTGQITLATPFNEIQGGGFSSEISKPLPTGGTAGITFSTDYTLVNQPPPDPGEFNPSYRTRLIFSVEQPLLRGFGTTVNQTPIIIARLTFDQEREKFYGAVNGLLFAVEQAYWDLYFSYWRLYTVDVALRQAHDAWQKAKQLREKELITVQDLAALESQYQALRLARLDALGGGGQSVLESERQLRFVVGLPVEDGCRLIPVDTPTTAPYAPDWCAAVDTALHSRPDLAQVRQEIKKLQVDMKRLHNQTLPDLRVAGSYDINGLGDRLDGSGQDNAFRSLASNHFNDWTVGLTLDVPIGFRAANAQLRRGQLQLTQRMILLRDLEKQTTFLLQQSYRDLVLKAEAVRIQSGIRDAATRRYQALATKFGDKAEDTTFFLLAQKDWITALTAERQSIFAYNIALAKFELDKGTIQQFDNVSISDGPLPSCVQGRASAHINDRTHGLVIRQWPSCGKGPGCADGSSAALIPAVSAGPPNLAALDLPAAPPGDVGQQPAAPPGDVRQQPAASPGDVRQLPAADVYLPTPRAGNTR